MGQADVVSIGTCHDEYTPGIDCSDREEFSKFDLASPNPLGAIKIIEWFMDQTRLTKVPKIWLKN